MKIRIDDIRWFLIPSTGMGGGDEFMNSCTHAQ